MVNIACCLRSHNIAPHRTTSHDLILPSHNRCDIAQSLRHRMTSHDCSNKKTFLDKTRNEKAWKCEIFNFNLNILKSSVQHPLKPSGRVSSSNLYLCSSSPLLHLHLCTSIPPLYLFISAHLHLHLCISAPAQSPLLNLSTYSAHQHISSSQHPAPSTSAHHLISTSAHL